MPCVHTHKTQRRNLTGRHPPQGLHRLTDVQRKRPRRSSPTFRDSAQEIYDRLVNLDADTLEVLDDYYSALSEAVEAAGDRHCVELGPHHTLYFFEYYKISKVGCANNPYACTQWPGIHIRQAIINLLDTKDLLVNFMDDNGGTEEHYIQLYERNPAGRGLDFDDAPDDKSDFVRYVVEL